MKAVILAGGFGSRLSEETLVRPKPMVEIGGKPILWHIMKSYSFHGINDFVICCGYKGYLIKEYFTSYFLHMCDLTLELRSNKMEFLSNGVEPWKVTLIDTGENTMTGGRLNFEKAFGATTHPQIAITTSQSLIQSTAPFQIHLTGDPNRTYLIQTSTNLLDWTGVYTNQTASDGTFDYYDSQAVNFRWCFYRGILVE